LAVLSDLVEKYEREHHPIEPLPPHQMLAESIAAKGITQTALSKATGIPISTISELIAQKREFNVSHVERLCAYFGLTPGAFVRVEPAHRKVEHEFQT
jgi:HTH-type transcriptional regulator/antitoxin HigA